MTIDELLNICRAATPGPYHIGHVSENGESVYVDDAGLETVAKVYGSQNQSYLCAFNPQRMEKILLALQVAKEALTYYESEAGGADSESEFNAQKLWVRAYDAIEAIDTALGNE